MPENDNKINQLLEKLETLLKRQDSFSKEIYELREEINSFKTIHAEEFLSEKQSSKIDQPVSNIIPEPQQKQPVGQPEFSAQKIKVSPKIKSDIEKFIGENLINKIGIAILVIGVAIGAKYSIDHQLISPLTRIILGYLMGLGVLGFGIKLKKNYENYSAVLVSGAIAIMYFITYAAYSFYGLIPQSFAFMLMVIFTAFTIIASINYNKQVIAHIGLVGAYAVPFLLSDGSGKVVILFTYMAIINIGVLIISIIKYWKALYNSSFILTWLIFLIWFCSKYEVNQHFSLSLIFISIFFITFYTMFLAYKLLQKEKFVKGDIILLLTNSFVFYGLGYSILNGNKASEQMLGLFTLCNAILHFCVSLVIFKQKLADRNLFFLISGLVLVFVTIAIPVQLSGNWITSLWACEAALLFWIGRSKNVRVYETLSYPVMLLALISITQDWINRYNNMIPEIAGKSFTPVFNIYFLTSVVVIASFVFINFIHVKQKAESITMRKTLNLMVSFFIPAILLIIVYFTFRIEIATYWKQMYLNTSINITREGSTYADQYFNDDLLRFKSIWIINYSLLFLSALSVLNIKKLKNRNLGIVNLVLITLAVIVFLTQGLYLLSGLRDSYLNKASAIYHSITSYNIGIRYISYGFIGFILTTTYFYIKQEFLKPLSFNLITAFDLLLYTSILWMASSELISLVDVMKSTETYKLGLSILWGIYALFIIALGIWKRKKYLRIAAIALFAVTLIKLFFYDIPHLETIAKTIIFVALGILLLIISFLYNKYKHIISGENEN